MQHVVCTGLKARLLPSWVSKGLGHRSAPHLPGKSGAWGLLPRAPHIRGISALFFLQGCTGIMFHKQLNDDPLNSLVKMSPKWSGWWQGGPGGSKASKNICKSTIARTYLGWEHTGSWTLEFCLAQEVPGSFPFRPAWPWVVTIERGNSLNGLVFTVCLVILLGLKEHMSLFFSPPPTFLLSTPYSGIKYWLGHRKTMLLLNKYELK